MIEQYATYLGVSPAFLAKAFQSLAVIALLWLIRYLICSVTKRRVHDPARLYHLRRTIAYVYTGLLILFVGRIWIRGIESVTTFLGLVSAGLAIAMHETVANLSGWLFIVTRKPFRVGDRIQIGDVAGDVIDIRLFQFSLIEIGNWVHAEQSTGRIVHVPNSRALRDTVANYETAFEYIWHEIPVLVTFESNWEEAKALLNTIAREKAEHLSLGVEEQIRRDAMRYLIYFSKLTPIVYTSVRDSGILLTIRYMVKPRSRRGSEEAIWEAILREFARHKDIELAYPTTRFYQAGEQNAPHGNTRAPGRAPAREPSP